MAIEKLDGLSSATTATQSAGSKVSARASQAVLDEPAAAPSADEIGAAVKQLQSHWDTVSPKSEFHVDYLSGLDVVMVRSADTGEIVRQIPSAQAVSLARLIADGGGTQTLAVLDVTV